MMFGRRVRLRGGSGEVAAPAQGRPGSPGGQARVFVRSPTAADRIEFLAAMRASRRLHRPWLAAVTTEEGYDALLERVDSERHEPLFVCRAQDGAIVGFFNLSEIIRGGLQSAFLGYAAVAAHAHNGYMSEGIQLVLAHAFVDLGLHRIEANIQPGNHRSIALVRGAGFVREGFSERYLLIEGRWRDHERWAINVERWRSRRADQAGAVAPADRPAMAGPEVD
jgi:[ribosomal protein S5]-alanine N-acetyltransferase